MLWWSAQQKKNEASSRLDYTLSSLVIFLATQTLMFLPICTTHNSHRCIALELSNGPPRLQSLEAPWPKDIPIVSWRNCMQLIWEISIESRGLCIPQLLYML